MKKIVRFIVQCVAGGISRLIPRSNNVWAFGGNKGLRFADNSMYFFKYCAKNTQRKNVWLARSNDLVNQIRDEGYLAYHANSLRGLFYGFRAKWHIFDVGIGDTSIYSSPGAKRLNLWHGYPIKDIRRLKPRPTKTDFVSRLVQWMHNSPKDNSDFYVVHQNTKYLWQITDSFDVRAENVIIANYPRNVVFKTAAGAKDDVAVNAKPWIEKLQSARDAGGLVIGYFPTWRGTGTNLFMGMRSAAEIQQLNQFLVEHNLTLATKWHGCIFGEYAHHGSCVSAEELNPTLDSFSNIEVLGFEQDLNSVLDQCDLLISDYSSVIADYLLGDRPQILMAYDLEEYKADWGFMFDYEDFAPGPITKSLNELLPALENFARNPQEFSARFSDQRKFLREDLFEQLQGSSIIIDKLESIQTQ